MHQSTSGHGHVSVHLPEAGVLGGEYVLLWFCQLLQVKPPQRFCPGEGNGNPLQYSCLENPMDRGAWWAAVHGVAKSRTRLSDFTFTFHFHALEKEMATHSSALAWRISGTGEPRGLPSMGRMESDTTEATQQQQRARIHVQAFCCPTHLVKFGKNQMCYSYFEQTHVALR